jgi:hypothetical protein
MMGWMHCYNAVRLSYQLGCLSPIQFDTSPAIAAWKERLNEPRYGIREKGEEQFPAECQILFAIFRQLIRPRAKQLV